MGGNWGVAGIIPIPEEGPPPQGTPAGALALGMEPGIEPGMEPLPNWGN